MIYMYPADIKKIPIKLKYSFTGIFSNKDFICFYWISFRYSLKKLLFFIFMTLIRELVASLVLFLNNTLAVQKEADMNFWHPLKKSVFFRSVLQ